MDLTKEIVIDMIGGESGLRRSGKFKVKTLLTRRDRFAADEARRRIVGVMADQALPALQEEAYVLGQLQVRIIEAPDWWQKANSGLDLEDGDVIAKLFAEAVAAEQERRDGLVGQAKVAHKELADSIKE
jgi:hypothetical protein